jgi:16S rRNA (guanine966-N2)-methyltransferase
LTAPPGRGTRPTSDKVREAVFGVLAALPETDLCLGGLPRDAPSAESAPPSGRLSGHVVLDAFAGSGALGIEALSRGASACTFVEKEPAAVRAVRANLARFGLGRPAAADPRRDPADGGAPQVRVLAQDIRRALQADARRRPGYTLVFADPPYECYAEVRPALARLLVPLLAPGAVIVVETAAGTAAGLPWRMVREKRYGDTRVTFLVAGYGDDEGVEADDEVLNA